MELLPDVEHAPLTALRNIGILAIATLTVLEALRWERRRARHRTDGGPPIDRSRRLLRVALTTVVVVPIASVVLFPLAVVVAHVVTPKFGPDRMPSDHGMKYENTSFVTRDGFTIRGWWVPAQTPRGVVLLAHGLAARRSMMLPQIEVLHTGGYDVLVFDWRASGQSDGYRAGYGVRETEDLLAAIEWLATARPDRAHWIGAMGLSYATAVLMQGSARCPQIRAFILDSPYVSIRAMVTWRFRMLGLGRGLEPVLLPIASVWSRIVNGVPLDEVDPLAHARAIGQRPVLLIHGTLDGNIPYQHSERLCATLRGPHECWFPDGVGHITAAQQAPGEYRRRVLAFLDLAPR